LSITSSASSFKVRFNDFEKVFTEKEISIDVPSPHLWSTEDPYLYDLTIETKNDVVTSYFVLRKIEGKFVNGHQRLFLNDKPLFLNSLLDQGYFKEGIFLPKDPEEYEKDVLSIKAMGFNCLRKHIKIEAEAFYYYCDRHGILVMQDMVNSGPYRFFRDTVLPTIGLTSIPCKIEDQKRYDFFLQHSLDSIEHLKSHPCIFAYTIYNEGWGQQDASKTYDILKKTDPKRLFDSTSGWFFDDHSDFDSYHIYFRNKVLKGRDKLLLLSECGGFIRQLEETKKAVWGYGKANSEKELTDKIIEMHEKMVLPSIENGLCGYIMTQISDVENELNGLFSYDRQVCKVDQEAIKKANQRLAQFYESKC
ncbi:MAG: glycoside hydrolase family 2, partial [Erysipelotrichaceae bacterium]|nr:glycoside hydrolase family 2 [Erysipelotrichaceae bacterium]